MADEGEGEAEREKRNEKRPIHTVSFSFYSPDQARTMTSSLGCGRSVATRLIPTNQMNKDEFTLKTQPDISIRTIFGGRFTAPATDLDPATDERRVRI